MNDGRVQASWCTVLQRCQGTHDGDGVALRFAVAAAGFDHLVRHVLPQVSPSASRQFCDGRRPVHRCGDKFRLNPGEKRRAVRVSSNKLNYPLRRSDLRCFFKCHSSLLFRTPHGLRLLRETSRPNHSNREPWIASVVAEEVAPAVAHATQMPILHLRRHGKQPYPSQTVRS